MKVVNTDEMYVIYNDCLKTYDQLPVQTYVVRFSINQGFYLSKYSELDLNEEIIYGEHESKIKKVMRSFKSVNRNFGIILSGAKGIGKSLFARMLANEAVDSNYPVIIIDRYIQGIASFIEQIDQECVLLFDEFDKTFCHRDSKDDDPQATMLSLFDGITPGKKMFVITCNEIYKLNDYLLNRPGRFHYHFRFKYPTPEEITVYLEDKLDPQYYDQIHKVILFSRKVDLNFDCLRAIAFELNNGESFESAILDLNIMNMERLSYNISIHFKDGRVMEESDQTLNLFSKEEYVALYDNSGDNIFNVYFDPKKGFFDASKGKSIIRGEDTRISREKCDSMGDEKYDYIDALIVDYIAIEKCKLKEFHYTV